MDVELGTVVAPTGAIVIVDAGLLGMWCHDRTPVLPDGILSDDAATARANDAVDLEIVGKAALTAGHHLDRQWPRRFVFDVPREDVPAIASALSAIVETHALDARLVILDQRVSHRRRIELAIEGGAVDGAGEFTFHGIPCAAVSGLSVGTMRVVGQRMPEDDEFSDRLRSVALIVRDTPIAHSDQFACVGVDWARLMFVDADALGLWQHDAPLDGRGDFVLWGRDADMAAAAIGLEKSEGRDYGWFDLPVEEAARHGIAFEERREREGWKVATDFRPHSHHYALMKQIRSSATESGAIALGDARACGLMTTWGDGVFDVYRSVDAQGQLVEVRVVFVSEDGTDASNS